VTKLLTAREIGEAIGLAPSTVLDKWERGELPGFKFGRAVRFDLEEVLEAGRGRRNASHSTPPGRGVVSAMPVTRRGEDDA
jgi:excisionase family DNA binding protein